MNFIKLFHLKGVKQLSSEIFYFKKTLKRYRKVLRKGRYLLFPSMRAMAVNRPSIYEEANKYFYKDIPVSPQVKLTNFINKCGFFHNTSTSTQEYDAFYIANNYNKNREVKLFAFDKNKILTICACREDYENQMDLYNRLHHYYAMPIIAKSDKFVDSYEISMVNLYPRPDETYALQNILDSAMNPMNCQFKKDLISTLVSFQYEDGEMNSVLNEIYCRISSELLDSYFPICAQHGDLSRDNLIYGAVDGKVGFWWIDWEHISPRMFLYDYYFYIINTALCYHDTRAYDIYIKGNHNEALKKYFEFFELEFVPEKLQEYFLVFLLVFLKERVCDLGNVTALRMYYECIKELQLLPEEQLL